MCLTTKGLEFFIKHISINISIKLSNVSISKMY